jgi:hypothetical protein
MLAARATYVKEVRVEYLVKESVAAELEAFMTGRCIETRTFYALVHETRSCRLNLLEEEATALCENLP